MKMAWGRYSQRDGRGALTPAPHRAALDPRTLRQCLDAAFDLAPTLVVIAHP